MEEIVLIDKPSGISSFDVIRILRKKLGVRKMGHAGTLDPLASGLLIIGIGRGTKQLNNLINLSKVYEATVRFGQETETGDLEGVVIRDRSCHLDTESIRVALTKLVGDVELPVPRYAAVKVDGKPLYWYARRKQDIDIPTKVMQVENAVLKRVFTDERYTYADITWYVGSGTYIRSLVTALGDALQVPAVLNHLRRIAIGPFRIEDALPLAHFEKQKDT